MSRKVLKSHRSRLFSRCQRSGPVGLSNRPRAPSPRVTGVGRHGRKGSDRRTGGSTAGARLLARRTLAANCCWSSRGGCGCRSAIRQSGTGAGERLHGQCAPLARAAADQPVVQINVGFGGMTTWADR
jgi:hypothetical protein